MQPNTDKNQLTFLSPFAPIIYDENQTNKPNLNGQLSVLENSALCRKLCSMCSLSASRTLLVSGTADSRPSSYMQFTYIDKLHLHQHDPTLSTLTFQSLLETFIKRSLFNSSSGSCHGSDATVYVAQCAVSLTSNQEKN